MTLELSDQGESSPVLAPGSPRDPHLTNRSADRSYYCAPNIVYLTNALSRGRVITGDDLVRLHWQRTAVSVGVMDNGAERLSAVMAPLIGYCFACNVLSSQTLGILLRHTDVETYRVYTNIKMSSINKPFYFRISNLCGSTKRTSKNKKLLQGLAQTFSHTSIFLTRLLQK